jgi:EAL domain-containing protein (putative c-di-GMP-specific phosphodiesterase class I)
VAQRSNLIVMLGDQVMHTVMRQLRTWQLAGLSPVPVAINVTTTQLLRTEFAIRVREAAIEHSIDPKLLAFEFAEAAGVARSNRHIAMITALRQAGSRIHMDDFGAGQSKPGQLRALPLDALKIDQSLVRHIDTDATDAATVGAIVTMARKLLLDTIAEGIETTQQAERLRGLGCRYGQGYYFSRPLPASGCNALLEQLASARTHVRTLKMRAFSRAKQAQ